MTGSPRLAPDKSLRLDWVRLGCPFPPPHEFKLATLILYRRWSGAKLFVETGTYKAETTAAMAPHFDRVISIELDPTLAAAAQQKFAKTKNVQILLGDSGLLLPKVVAELDQRTLFWLDGHNCGAGTGMSKDFGPTPIMRELETIFAHHIKDHVIIIDDQRYFTGEWGYPTIDELFRFVHRHRPDLVMDICTDSIRIHPEKF